ncbi:hypothetical protein DFQ28_000552 [Apophysomyces sp. BC1034]|nr:hypothetical protein DFQ28_000552 [Apophysomyces sp. BC1034]
MALTATERAARVKLMIFDVDGVLTDGTLYFTCDGDAMKGFNSMDGHGLKLLEQAGISTAIITGRHSKIVERRARELHVPHLYQGISDKLVAFGKLLEAAGVAADECGYMGDDWPDLAVMLRVGFAAAPASAHPEVLGRAHWIANARGGHGAAREVIDTLLRAQHRLPHPSQVVTADNAHTPDYFADDFSISMLDESGVTQYRITAASMIHYEDDAATHATQPAIRAFTPGQPVVTVTGKRAIINADGSIVDLYNNARIVRDAGPADPRMQADSEHFRVLTNDDIIETGKPVKLLRGASQMAANGMIYNNVTREMHLLGQVRGMITASDTAAGGAFRK